ncbi:unnamed protein product [Didymodactylos carnosus]|uniref:Uncharacterized protein n=1 Tax=Didymodactylos carnosus TaxID=1234261 RepID=A0A8S2TIM2_9BILA|nr:unnamed protein product [Didymodactylos carnosus]
MSKSLVTTIRRTNRELIDNYSMVRHISLQYSISVTELNQIANMFPDINILTFSKFKSSPKTAVLNYAHLRHMTHLRIIPLNLNQIDAPFIENCIQLCPVLTSLTVVYKDALDSCKGLLTFISENVRLPNIVKVTLELGNIDENAFDANTTEHLSTVFPCLHHLYISSVKNKDDGTMFERTIDPLLRYNKQLVYLKLTFHRDVVFNVGDFKIVDDRTKQEEDEKYENQFLSNLINETTLNTYDPNNYKV